MNVIHQLSIIKNKKLMLSDGLDFYSFASQEFRYSYDHLGAWTDGRDNLFSLKPTVSLFVQSTEA